MDGDEVAFIEEFTYQDGDAQGLGFSVVGDDITNIMLWNNKNIIRDVSIGPSINMKQLNINAADMLCQMGLPESSMLQAAVRLNELTAKLIQNGCDAVNVAGIARLSVVAYNLAQKG